MSSSSKKKKSDEEHHHITPFDFLWKIVNLESESFKNESTPNETHKVHPDDRNAALGVENVEKKPLDEPEEEETAGKTTCKLCRVSFEGLNPPQQQFPPWSCDSLRKKECTNWECAFFFGQDAICTNNCFFCGVFSLYLFVFICILGVAEQREHFKLDWHRFNMQRKVRGKPRARDPTTFTLRP